MFDITELFRTRSNSFRGLPRSLPHQPNNQRKCSSASVEDEKHHAGSGSGSGGGGSLRSPHESGSGFLRGICSSHNCSRRNSSVSSTCASTPSCSAECGGAPGSGCGRGGAGSATAPAMTGLSGSFKEEYFRNGPLGMFLVVPAVNVRQNSVKENYIDPLGRIHR